jgi:hypothetical protein
VRLLPQIYTAETFGLLTHYRFAEKVLKAVKGETGLVEPSYVYLPGIPGGAAIVEKTGCEFFSVPIELGVSIPSNCASDN